MEKSSGAGKKIKREDKEDKEDNSTKKKKTESVFDGLTSLISDFKESVQEMDKNGIQARDVKLLKMYADGFVRELTKLKRSVPKDE